MTSSMKYTRFFMQHDRVYNALLENSAVVYMRAQSGILAETRLEQETTNPVLLAADSGDSVIGVKSQAQPESVAYNAYGYHNPNDIPLQRPAFNGHLLLCHLYLLGNGYRGYNSVLMRSQSPDSLSPFDAGGLNCYAYCAGDPVNFSDPSGHSPRPRSVSLSGRMSESQMKRIVSGVFKNPSKRPRRYSEGGTMSSLLLDHTVQDVLNAQRGWNTSGALVQSGPQRSLASSSVQAQGDFVAGSAATRLAHPSASSGTGLQRGRPIRRMGEPDAAILVALNKKMDSVIWGMDVVRSREAREIIIMALKDGVSPRLAIESAGYRVRPKQVYDVTSNLKVALKIRKGG
ncbi:RHS repeat-associated core domain-containing protein [Pseudomonas sp. LLC-1]|uniref:RHS repeat-associated core domain-containing protein n=1 Tax=Pseudomonas sp. LLC-1 TaxID=1812180 RepID=UPI000D021F02|nr:RHS repeat-associated core domain-containing protein [Pseudomonas sp. LLC-1]